MKEIRRVFGLHFDFHADGVTPVGENTKIEEIEKYILDTKPDFVQCDCKGHNGFCSYPTKLGNATNIKKDNLRIWADACKKHNVPLFVHYSGVMDGKFVHDNPDQVERKEDGVPYGISTSVFGNYAERVLIPQFKELITEYGITGAWIDGEIWAINLDFSDLAKPHLWEGITPAEHGRVMREGFFKYVENYISAIRQFNPDFKIISNWLYSSYAPEKPVLDVDFLSGDFQPLDSAHFVRLESRVLGVQGKKWDLMAWSFAYPGFTAKSVPQLCQEAALVLAQGGGFQLYVRQNMDGSTQKYSGDRLKRIADFVHEREFLYNLPPKAQIGVLYSADSFYQKNNCFNHNGAANALIGAVNLLIDSGYTANVVLEWQLDDISEYDAVVIPEWEFISDQNKQKLMNYAKNGGNLVVMGVGCGLQFMDLIGEKCEVKNYKEAFIINNAGDFAIIRKDNDETLNVLDLQDGDGGIYSVTDIDYKVSSAYKTYNVERGNITFIPFDFGLLYFEKRNYVYKEYITEIFNTLFEKFITTNSFIDVTMQKGENGIYLNLINIGQGRHSLAYETFDEIPVMNNVEIIVNKELSCVSAPLNDEFSFEIKGGKTIINLKKLEIHTVLLLEE